MKIFKEEQKFNQWWLFVILGVTLSFGIYSTFTEWSNDKSTNLALIFVCLSNFIICGFIYYIKLITRIDEYGVHYQFKPLGKKTILWDEIEDIHVRQYNPVKEYGGWGIHFTFGKKGKAYNISGNKGIQIKLKNKKPILIGTQKENDVELIVKNYFKK